MDADEHKALGKRFGVQGFPTLKWFDGKSEVPEDYKGGRDLESLTAWVTEKTGIRPRAKKAVPSAVEVLSDGTFKGVVGGESDVIVAFTAPWCGREFFFWLLLLLFYVQCPASRGISCKDVNVA